MNPLPTDTPTRQTCRCVLALLPVPETAQTSCRGLRPPFLPRPHPTHFLRFRDPSPPWGGRASLTTMDTRTPVLHHTVSQFKPLLTPVWLGKGFGLLLHPIRKERPGPQMEERASLPPLKTCRAGDGGRLGAQGESMHLVFFLFIIIFLVLKDQ